MSQERLIDVDTIINQKVEQIRDEVYKLSNKTYVVFDIETTGLSYREDYITEIGAVKIHKGEIVDTYQTFIRVPVNVPPKIVQLTNITDELLATEGIEESAALVEFYQFIYGCDLVAQNSQFDMGFLTYAFLRNGMLWSRPCLDTMIISKIQNPLDRSHNLKTLCSRYQVEYDSGAHHRADYDALITAKVLMAQLIKSIGQGHFEQAANNKNLDASEASYLQSSLAPFLDLSSGQFGEFVVTKDNLKAVIEFYAQFNQ